MKKLLSSVSAAAWAVAGLALAAVVAVVAMILADRSLGKFLTSNLPAEAMGLVMSALVTVFIVEAALAASEKRRRLPLSQKILWRIRAHSSSCIANLLAECSLDSTYVNDSDDQDTSCRSLRRAIEREDCYSGVDSSRRQALYDEVAKSRDVLVDELSRHQVVFSWYPHLYRSIIDVDYRILEWSAYRERDLSAEQEPRVITAVARAVLALDEELEKIPEGP